MVRMGSGYNAGLARGRRGRALASISALALCSVATLFVATSALAQDAPAAPQASEAAASADEIIVTARKHSESLEKTPMALSVADRGYVMVTGTLTVEGTPAQLLDNEEVRAAYLGGGKQAAAV